MQTEMRSFLKQHSTLTRRFFLQAGLATSMLPLSRAWSAGDKPELDDAIKKLGPFFTAGDEFRDVSRGNPKPHTLPDETKSTVGMTRDTWKLEVVSDTEHPARLRSPLTLEDNTALDFAGLMQLAEKHAVRFPKIMTCLNIGTPLGMGLWEGIPLREVLWLTQPRDNLRRVFYHGYHNDDPKQEFRSSLPVGRVLEDPLGLPPVILCYKLNGDWLSSERGGPVRIVVPEGYGFKSIKWVNKVILSNLFHANDTYANGNNDVDSPLKTFSITLSVPRTPQANQPIPITGIAQVGISGLSKVQVWIHPADEESPAKGPNYSEAPWQDAKVLGPPQNWGEIPDGKLPAKTFGFDPSGTPREWPIRLAKAHWAHVVPGLAPGKYILRSRTVDLQGHAQPGPRPFRKSGRAAIEQITIEVQ